MDEIKETMGEESKTELKGAFVDSLKRNNRQIKNDRAMAIVEDAEMTYRREVEDLEIELKRMHREQEGMIDLSPADSITLKLANEFNAREYVQKDMELGLRIRNTEIKLEVAKRRFYYLFQGGA